MQNHARAELLAARDLGERRDVGHHARHRDAQQLAVVRERKRVVACRSLISRVSLASYSRQRMLRTRGGGDDPHTLLLRRELQ